MTRKILILCIILNTAFTSSLMALGLGEIKLKSGLNQPLDAEILLLSLRGESNEQLRGTIGSSSDFSRSGIDRLYFLTKIKFETITKANGQKVLHLTTKEAVREPFLNFLVNLEWPNGRLLREYTLLLDPPIFDEAPKARVTPPPAARTEKAKTVSPEIKPQRVAPKPQWQGEVYGPTSRNDTLWGIASKVRPDSSISIQRAMVSIFEANPDAFMRGNINNLKRGAEIQIPDNDAFADISQREALRVIAAHNESWKSGRTVTPRVVVDTSSEDSYRSDTESSSNNSGRLSLSTDDETTGQGGSSSTDVLIEEENEVLKDKNEALTEQVQTDAEKIQQLERLLELKSEQLAQIQNRDKNEIETPDSTDMPGSEIDESAQSTTQNAVAESATPEQTPVETMDNTVMQPIQAKPKELSLMDDLKSGAYNLYLLIAGGVVLLLLIISIVRRRNKDIDYKDAVADTARKIATSGVKEEVALEIPDGADEILAGTDALDLEETGIEESNASDPLGEADIYIAYGKFDQAEKLLLSVLQEQPDNMDFSSKLLECYAEMDAKDKFEDYLVTITSAMEIDSELSQYIEDLYRTSWPEGNFFGSDADDYEQESIDDFDDSQKDVKDEISVPDGSDDDIEELPSTEDVFGELSEEDVELEYDDELASDEGDIGEDYLTSDEDIAPDTDDSDIDDFDIDDSDIDDSDIDDSGESDIEDADFDDLDDEESDIDTQLDLAKAYIEMGDADGTREIIAEIMESGTKEQQEEAQKILDSLED